MDVVSKLTPSELISKFTSSAPPRVQDAVRSTILGLIGNLPRQAFDTTTMTTGERLASLMFQLQMTGYMFKNADYRLSLTQSLGGMNEDSSSFLLNGLLEEAGDPLLAGIIKGKIKVRVEPKEEEKTSKEEIENDEDDDEESSSVSKGRPETPLDETSEPVELVVDAAAYFSEIRDEVARLRRELNEKEEEKAEALRKDLLVYIRTLPQEQMKSLTTTMSDDVLTAMKGLVNVVLAGLGEGKIGPNTVTEQSGEAMAQLCMWQLVIGYNLRELEVREQLRNSFLSSESGNSKNGDDDKKEEEEEEGIVVPVVQKEEEEEDDLTVASSPSSFVAVEDAAKVDDLVAQAEEAKIKAEKAQKQLEIQKAQVAKILASTPTAPATPTTPVEEITISQVVQSYDEEHEDEEQGTIEEEIEQLGVIGARVTEEEEEEVAEITIADAIKESEAAAEIEATEAVEEEEEVVSEETETVAQVELEEQIEVEPATEVVAEETTEEEEDIAPTISAEELAQAEKITAEFEAAQRAAEEEIERAKAAEEEAAKLAAEALAEAERAEAAALEAKRLAEEEAKRLAQEAEAKRVAQEAEEKRLAEEAKLLAEQEAKKRAEQEAKLRAEEKHAKLRADLEARMKPAEIEANGKVALDSGRALVGKLDKDDSPNGVFTKLKMPPSYEGDSGAFAFDVLKQLKMVEKIPEP
mmetsp:Transcript_21443/g.32802  ORF Transcript_21443/g.32802 Transcript_21443/m.32802 type:complete len:694 (+) Transcript_21443:1209-3290(+)